MHDKVLLTIVTESILEKRLIEDLVRFGAHGYTITDARGSGAHGPQRGSFEFNANIRIEVLTAASVANAVSEHFEETYFADYGMVLWQTEVKVLRGSKF